MYSLKQCIDCGKDFIPTGPRSIRCRDCKGTKPAAKKTTRKKATKLAVSDETLQIALPGTGEDVMRLHGFNAPTVTLTLGVAQVQKLLALLLG